MNTLSHRFLLSRISPTRSARATSLTPSTRTPSEVTHIQKPVQSAAPPQPDPELDLEIDTAAAEEAARAARRARRQAILARHSGVASANKSISPSPGPSSAVQPQPVASVSDTPQPHSAVDTSASLAADTSKARHDSMSKPLSSKISCRLMYYIMQVNETLHLHNQMTVSLSLLRTRTTKTSVRTCKTVHQIRYLPPTTIPA